MQYVGTVKKIYLPKQKTKDGFLDDLNKTNIGFEVLVNGKLMKFEMPQDFVNCEVCREDKVLITKNGKNVEVEVIDA